MSDFLWKMLMTHSVKYSRPSPLFPLLHPSLLPSIHICGICICGANQDSKMSFKELYLGWLGWLWWLMPVIPTFGRQQEEDQKLMSIFAPYYVKFELERCLEPPKALSQKTKLNK